MTEFEKGYEQGYKDGVAGAALPNVNDNGDKIDGYGYAYKTDSRGEPYIHIDSVRSMLKKAADVQPVVDTENMATVSDEFICKKCGIYLKDYIKVVMDEDNDGYIDEQHYEYEPKFCPECGAKVESCIKIPKRDKPLYTMDEICKMNGVEFNPPKDGDTNG